MTESADTVLRLLTMGAFALIAATLVVRQPRQSLTWLLVILIACTTAYLLLSGGDPLAPDMGLFRLLLLGLAPTVPFAVWAVVMTAFDDAFRHVRVCIAALALLAAMQALAFATLPEDLRPALVTLQRIGGLLMLSHAVFRTLAGRRDDLMERRRRWRLIAVAMMVLQVTSVLLVELVVTEPEMLALLTPVNAGAILALTLLFGVSFLTIDPVEPPQQVPRATPGQQSCPPDDRVAGPLRAFIDSGGLWQSGLTVAGLAAKAGVTEHRLRSHINRDLGYRNFNAFLNVHRVAEAQKRLADPELARTPVLTIAMDLGYGSLGPFNRAFREITGTTPTAYRRENIADS
ncbi:MAG: transcriptional regulator [Minwuia thermotolerans]|nr:MAG: transcriptional regulator [Minwuia thermotolerans]